MSICDLIQTTLSANHPDLKIHYRKNLGLPERLLSSRGAGNTINVTCRERTWRLTSPGWDCGLCQLAVLQVQPCFGQNDPAISQKLPPQSNCRALRVCESGINLQARSQILPNYTLYLSFHLCWHNRWFNWKVLSTLMVGLFFFQKHAFSFAGHSLLVRGRKIRWHEKKASYQLHGAVSQNYRKHCRGE